MSRGRRYEERKLNMKKVFAVILAIVVIIMSIFIIRGIFSKEEKTGGITSKTYFAAFKDNKWGVIDENGETVIKMTLTTMGCPLADILTESIHDALKEVPEVTKAEVKLVWYPAWTTDKMSRYARIALGIR